jgi:hypothetical protein
MKRDSQRQRASALISNLYKYIDPFELRKMHDHACRQEKSSAKLRYE